MRTLFFAAIIVSPFVLSCNSKTPEPKAPLTAEQLIQKNLDSLKAMAQDGDMITRMNDNIVSFHVKNFNTTDKSFSHAGIVMTRNGQKVVCNIDANEKGVDTVRYDVIDSFLNPKENSLCGLFRFKLSEIEKQNFLNELNKFHSIRARFDRVFDLATDSMIYCSEMISKSLNRATQGRLAFKEIPVPKFMLPIVTKFFEEDSTIQVPRKLIKKTVESRKFIAIDNLYLVPECTEMMRFKLKYFPGDEIR